MQVEIIIEQKPSFVLYFRRKRQWANVFLWDVHPNTFDRWDAGRWGYFERGGSSPSRGFFGELHFVKNRLRVDTISHEIDHLREEWIWANRLAWDKNSEEKFIEFKDIIFWRFIRELAKKEPAARLWLLNLEQLQTLI